MQEGDLATRVSDLEQRLTRLEELFDLQPQRQDPPEPAPKPGHPPVVELRAPAPKPLVSQLLEAQAHYKSPNQPPPSSPLPQSPKTDFAKPPPPSASSSHTFTALPQKSPSPQNPATLEQTIGLKWTGWIGAIVLVIGAGYGIKFAYDHGWFALVSPVVRLSMMATAGFALIAAGECVYRKINRLSAVGLFGAGVAVLFLVSYAGHAYYNLYEPNTAFFFMAICTLLGSAVAMRGNLISIAVLSLLGGNLAPLLLQSDYPSVFGFLNYLLMLQVVAMVLAWWGGDAKWWTLRALSLAGKCVWVTVILTTPALSASVAVLPFILAFAILYQAELILSAYQSRQFAAKSGLNFSLLVTAGLTVALLYYFRDSTHFVRAVWVLGLAAATGAVGFVLSRQKQKPPTLQPLAWGFALQSAALLVVWAPIALSGIWLIAGWGILAVAFGIIGMWADLPMARYFAAAVWTLAVGDIALFAQLPNNGSHTVWFTIAGCPIPAYAVMSWWLAVVGHVVTALLRSHANDKTDSQAAHSISSAVALLASVLWIVAAFCSLPPLGATLCLIFYVWLLAIADIFAPDLPLLTHSLVILALATLKWIVIDTLENRLAPGWTPGADWPLLNPLVGTAILISASIVGIYRLRHRRIIQMLDRTPNAGSARLAIFAIVTVLMTFAFTAEIDRIVERWLTLGHLFSWPLWQLKQMYWTILWSLVISGFTFVISRLETRPIHQAQWLQTLQTLAVTLAAKFFVLDTLAYRLLQGSNPAAAAFNTQLFAALIVAGTLFFIRKVSSFARDGASTDRLSSAMSFGATLILLWAGTLEIDRLVVRYIATDWMGFSVFQWRNLLWTTWWTIGISSFLLAANFKGSPDVQRRALVLNTCGRLLPLLAAKYLIVDTACYRFNHGPALSLPLLNISVLTAAVVLAGLVLLLQLARPGELKAHIDASLNKSAAALIILILLWTGTLEIDRAFQAMTGGSGWFADPVLAEQVALSIFWSIFAALSVITGFYLRIPALRYFALGLFAVTLLKVVVIDMSQVSSGYRVLSFIGLGGLLLSTSVLYGKLSPKLQRPAIHA